MCAAALLFRTPLRTRYWAWRLAHAGSAAERCTYLAALCNAGPAARWAIRALMIDPQPEVRQYAVLVSQRLENDWARRNLLEAAKDTDAGVRRLAAAALALHGDDSVVPVLKWLYQAGDEISATTACMGLARLGSPAAVNTLNELSREPAETSRRSALADALVHVGKPECVPGLLRLLDDEREYSSTAPEVSLRGELATELEIAGYRLSTTPSTTSQGVVTIAGRAAEGLQRITGLALPCESRQERMSAAQQWRDWHARRVSRQKNADRP